MSKSIVVITYGYPNEKAKNEYVFLKELLIQLSNSGNFVYVIHPVSFRKRGEIYINESESTENLLVYEPYFNDYKALFYLRPIHLMLTDQSFFEACDKVFRSLNIRHEETIIYSHFLNAGMCASRLAQKYNMRAYCAVGESTFWSIKYRPHLIVKKRLSGISGYIALNSVNKERLINLNFATEKNVVVIPNGVNLDLFRPINKEVARRKLGIPIDKKIGIFVGAFIQRKGVASVVKAVKDIDVKEFQMIYIGKGSQRPDDPHAFFIGEVKHNDIPWYLSASDFFVLPTLNEGSCNAIIEAIACGLPIISSKERFNSDLMDVSYAISVNPNNVKEIHDAIVTLIKDVKKREQMSESARLLSVRFDMVKRAQIIGEFIGIF